MVRQNWGNLWEKEVSVQRGVVQSDKSMNMLLLSVLGWEITPVSSCVYNQKVLVKYILLLPFILFFSPQSLHGRSGLNSWLLALVWPISGYCGRFVSFSIPLFSSTCLLNKRKNNLKLNYKWIPLQLGKFVSLPQQELI